MDLNKVLLFVLVSLVSLTEQFHIFVAQLLRVKSSLIHYVWLFLHKFLPRRYFVLEKVPKHVAFSIGDHYNLIDGVGSDKEVVSLPDLARLVFWCGRYGVEKVTIYDWLGVVTVPSNTKLLSHLVWRKIVDPDHGCSGLKLLVNGIAFDKLDDCDELISGSRDQVNPADCLRTLELITLDWRAGRRGVVQAARSFATTVKLERGTLNEKMEPNQKLCLTDYLTRECAVTAPDLLIEFGGCAVGDSTCGYPPLALRVAEIVRVPRHRDVDELRFLECLEKYSMRDRRFGK